MKFENLQKVAKQHKINLEHFDEVIAWVSESYKWVYIIFAERENCGCYAYHRNQQSVKLSVFSIQNREEDVDDYCTKTGWEWISDIKRKSIN